MAKPMDESANSSALVGGRGGGVGGSSRLHLGKTTASWPIDDCQATTARKRVRALGFRAEATLVQAKLSTGQLVQKTGINEAMRLDLLCLSWHSHTQPTVAPNWWRDRGWLELGMCRMLNLTITNGETVSPAAYQCTCHVFGQTHWVWAVHSK